MLVNNNQLPQNGSIANKTREYYSINSLSNKSDKTIDNGENISISFDAQLRLEHENKNNIEEPLRTEYTQKASKNVDNIYQLLDQHLKNQGIGEREQPVFMTYHPSTRQTEISSQNADITFHLNSLIESTEGESFHQLSEETFNYMQKLAKAKGEIFSLNKPEIIAHQLNESLGYILTR